jgi:hypothetical protein
VKEEEPIVENTFKPKKRMKEKQDVKKPVGWEETVQRLRLARIDRNEIQAALDPRSGPVKVAQESKWVKWRRSQGELPEKKVNGTNDVDAVLGI